MARIAEGVGYVHARLAQTFEIDALGQGLDAKPMSGEPTPEHSPFRMSFQRTEVAGNQAIEANRRGVLRLDGGYFATRVRRVNEKGLAGSWASGTAQAQAAGHFCASRLDSTC